MLGQQDADVILDKRQNSIWQKDSRRRKTVATHVDPVLKIKNALQKNGSNEYECFWMLIAE